MTWSLLAPPLVPIHSKSNSVLVGGVLRRPVTVKINVPYEHQNASSAVDDWARDSLQRQYDLNGK